MVDESGPQQHQQQRRELNRLKRLKRLERLRRISRFRSPFGDPASGSLISRFSLLLRGHFFTGLLVFIPFGVIAWILAIAVSWLWQLQLLLPQEWQPSSFIQDQGWALVFNVLFTAGAALAIALGLSFLGWISKQFLGKKILEIAGDIVQRIPVVRSIYSALDQLLRTLAAGGGQQFSRVVYVEYPRKGTWALAFVTGPVKSKALPSGMLNLYVPTTPNPTSGFHLIVPETEVKESGLRVEEAFRTILSLGIAQGDPTATDTENAHG
ncbi:DUF502 domain-containing protein [bacterium]|nr:DUF502 domain-containing protein [bacterium]